MKKTLYSLLALLMFTLGSVTGSAQATDWAGKYISSVGEPASTLTDGKFYLAYNTGRGTWLYESGSNLMLGAVSTATSGASTSVKPTLANVQSAFQNSSSLMAYVVKFVADGDNWKTQFQSGNYMQDLPHGNQATSGETAVSFTLYSGTDDATLHALTQTTSSGYSWNGNGSSFADGGWSFTGWDANNTPSLGGNNTYMFYPVDLADGYTITYNVKDSNGNTIYTTSEVCVPGADFPTVPSSVDGFYTITGDAPTGTVTADATYEFTLTYDSNAPITVSSDAGDNATWTGLATRESKYLAIEGASAGSNIYSSNITSQKVFSDAFKSYDAICATRLWCFIGNPLTGFQIINKYNGLAMGYDATSNSSNLTMKATTNANTYFIIDKTSDGLWQIHPVGVTQYISDYSGDWDSELKFWKDGATTSDLGSAISFIAVDDIPVITYANIPDAPTSSLLDAEKTYTPSVVSAFDFASAQAETSKTGEELYNAYILGVQENTYYKIRVSRHDLQTGTDGYSDEQYRWISSYQTKAYTTGLFKNDAGTYKDRPVRRVQATGDVIPMLFTFEKQDGVTSNEGYQKYRIRNANTGLALSPVGNSDMTSLEYEGTGSNYWLELASGTNDEWILKTSEGSNGYNASNGVDNASYVTMGSYDQTDGGSHFYIIPVSEISLTIYDDTQYASACYPFAVTLPAGLTAYAVSKEADGEATLTAIGSQTIPAKTPVFIAAGSDATAASTGTDTKTYTLTINPTDESTYSSTNLLEGATASREGFAASTATEGTAFYALATNGTTAVMKKNGEVTTMPANKAYYPYTLSSSTRPMTLYFNVDETTGINAISTSEEAEGSNTYYDLNGRRVLYPVHGIYVKGNGQKVYIK